MQKITIAQLRKFGLRVDGQGELTEAVCREHAADVDWDAAAAWLLPSYERDEYRRAMAHVLAEHERDTAPAWAEFERATAPMREAYHVTRTMSWRRYARATAPAWAEFERAMAPAWASYCARAAAAFWAAYRG